MDELNNELIENSKKLLYYELPYEQYRSKFNLSKDFHMNFISREKSIITDYFYSQFINTVTCKCGKLSYGFEKIMDIPLIFPNESKTSYTLLDLLNYFFEPANINYDKECYFCHKIVKRKKVIKFTDLAKILIFSFQNNELEY